jgi:carnitine O-palmitoyltransferase 1, liver isoform
MAGAASYSSSLIHETDADNQKVLTLIWKSGLRSWKKRFIQFKIKVRNGAYPAHLESLWVIISIVTVLHFSSYKMPYNIVNNLFGLMPRYDKIKTNVSFIHPHN